MRYDLGSYQSAETAWRYDYRTSQLKDEIAKTETLLAHQREALLHLEARPPLYHLFNWSA